MLTLLVALCCSWWAPAALAAPGDLDATFSGEGRQTIDFGSGGRDHGRAIARQADGKLVAVGSINEGFGVWRYNADGSVDTSFSGDGRHRTVFGDAASAAALAIQGDGKIVVVGTTGLDDDFSTSNAIAIARYNSDGSLDTSFSGDGKQRTDFFGGTSSAAGIALQADGKIVAVGSAGFSSSGFAVARYNPDGSLDTSFSDDGKQTTDFGGGGAASAGGVAVHTDGKLVVVGSAQPSSTSGDTDFAVARYNADGSLDTSFSGDGKQTTDFAPGAFISEAAAGVALQGDGKVVAVGNKMGSGGFAVARYSADGSLDPSFSGDGKEITDVGGFHQAAAGAAIQGDGKIVVVGTAGNDASFGEIFALVRYNADGSLDTDFSGDGKQTTDFGGSGSRSGASGVLLQGDGKVVAVGGAAPQGSPDLALARYSPEGSLDITFSGDGKQTADSSGRESAADVAIQGDGKIVAVGDSIGEFTVTRHNPDGSLDTSFSGDGVQTINVADDTGDRARAVAVQPDGKVVVVGVGVRFEVSVFELVRLNPDGSLDTGFSGDGRETTSFGGFNEGASAVAIQPDGKIVAAGGGAGDINGNEEFALARYDADGSLDTSFSGDGKATVDFGAGSASASGLALQSDGKVVAVGSDGALDFAVARLNADGSLDTGFSGDGKQTTDLGTSELARAVDIHNDGRIVVAGGGLGNSSLFALVRYNPNGSLDTSFSGDGKQTTSFGGSVESAAGVAVQADGKAVVVGTSGDAEPGGLARDFALARYNPDGSLDTGFSGDGKQTTDFGGLDSASGMALQSDGKIVAAGSAESTGETGLDLALARYEGDAAAADTTAPDTTITGGPAGVTSDPTPTFAFSSSEAGSTFECRVDAAAFASCSSPHTTAVLTGGTHSFAVRATDAAGNTDQTPATRTFSVATSGAGGPGPTGPFTDLTPPVARLSGSRSQKAGPTVAVTVSCGSEACRAVASGTVSVPGAAKLFKLRSAAKRVAAGRKATLRLRVPAKALRAIRKALRRKRKVTARLRVRVTDAAGNTRTSRRSVRIRR